MATECTAGIAPSAVMRTGSVDTCRSSKPPKYAPARAFHPTSSFPPRAPRGSEFPRFPGTTKTLRLLSARHPALLALRGVTLGVPQFRSRDRRHATAGLEVGSRRPPDADWSKETDRSLRFLGNPSMCSPWSSTPAGSETPGPIQRPDAAPAVATTWAPASTVLSRLNTWPAHSLSTLRSRRRRRPRKTRFRLWANSTGWDWLPIGFRRKVSRSLRVHPILLSQAY